MSIRQATDHDRDALAALDRRSWSVTTNPILPDGTTWFVQELALENVLVASRDSGDGNGEALCGYVHLANAMPAHLFSAAHSGRIRGIAVAPEARGQGLGARLLDAAQELARARSYRKLVLQVMGSNPQAQRLYERAGFVREGCLTGLFYVRGEYVDDLWYAKWL